MSQNACSGMSQNACSGMSQNSRPSQTSDAPRSFDHRSNEHPSGHVPRQSDRSNCPPSSESPVSLTRRLHPPSSDDLRILDDLDDLEEFDKGKDVEVICCPICLSEDLQRPARPGACNHVFCFECIIKWSEVTNKCPLCKEMFAV
eukprot:GHVO01044172.1.p1 GENE.GHVO01044172.1~~GHVO01044172.1.p1  ORF type:complete len:145 (+),score=36.17 GHVO01044172.1:3-437(+)